MASNLSTDQILAAMEQLSPSESEKLVPQVIALGAARRAPHLAPEESALLERISEPLPHALIGRLHDLQEKRDNLDGVDGSIGPQVPGECLASIFRSALRGT